MAFFEALKPYGAKAINIRGYKTASSLSESGLVLVRTAPECFMPVYDEPRYYEGNPLPYEAQRRIKPFSWSELPWHDPKWRWVWQVLQDCACPDGLCVPCHGLNGYFGAVSLAFDRMSELSPAEVRAITLAGYLIHEHLIEANHPDIFERFRLTKREADCLSFVASGFTDAEIAQKMNVSVPTIAFHISNARKKLGARTRAQAVAKFVSPLFR